MHVMCMCVLFKALARASVRLVCPALQDLVPLVGISRNGDGFELGELMEFVGKVRAAWRQWWWWRRGQPLCAAALRSLSVLCQASRSLQPAAWAMFGTAAMYATRRAQGLAAFHVRHDLRSACCQALWR